MVGIKKKRLWLSEEKTIALTIEQWEWIAETGKPKELWPRLEIYTQGPAADCFLCEHAIRVGGIKPGTHFTEECQYCLLVKYLSKKCSDLESPFLRYPCTIAERFSTASESRREVAKACLPYLREVQYKIKEAKNGNSRNSINN